MSRAAWKKLCYFSFNLRTFVAGIHKMCFGLFVLSSVLGMISKCLLNTMVVMETEFEKKSARRKKIYLLINIASLAACCYFYYRHNTYCEPGG